MKLKKSVAVSESGFVFDPMSGESFSVNEIGIELLSLLKQEKTPEEISEYFIKTYDVDSTDFEKYYYDFIGMLRQYQLLEEYDPD